MKIKSKTMQQIVKDSEKLGPGVKFSPSRVMTKEESLALDEKAGLKMISLRLPLATVERLKSLAEKEGIKYQPFIRKYLIKLASEGDQQQLTETRVQELIDQRLARWSQEQAGKKAAS